MSQQAANSHAPLTHASNAWPSVQEAPFLKSAHAPKRCVVCAQRHNVRATVERAHLRMKGHTCATTMQASDLSPQMPHGSCTHSRPEDPMAVPHSQYAVRALYSAGQLVAKQAAHLKVGPQQTVASPHVLAPCTPSHTAGLSRHACSIVPGFLPCNPGTIVCYGRRRLLRLHVRVKEVCVCSYQPSAVQHSASCAQSCAHGPPLPSRGALWWTQPSRRQG